MIRSRALHLKWRYALVFALVSLAGCQTMFSSENWSGMLNTEDGPPRAPWSPSLWSPSTWNPFGRMILDQDAESAHASALKTPALRHFLSKGAWEFDPLRLGARSLASASVDAQFVGKLSGLDADTRIRQSALYETLQDEDVNISTGAAILLAQRHNAVGRRQLKAALENLELPIGMRCAAAEALGALGHDQDLLIEELQQARAAAKQPENTYYPAWHAALVLAVSASVHPSNSPELHAQFYEQQPEVESKENTALPPECSWPQPEVRAASLLAWRGASMPLPQEPQSLRDDPLPQLRTIYCRVAAVTNPLAEFEHAVASLQDPDLGVRFAAIELLGNMPANTPQADDATQPLRGMLEGRGDLLQAAAVESLGRLGDWQTIKKAAAHDAWRVRQAVANQFRRSSAPQDPLLLRRLLTDGNIAVQEAAVNSLRTKPLLDSGDLLLYAIENSSRVAAINAETILSLKWPAATALREVRDEADARLRVVEQLGQQLGADLQRQAEAARLKLQAAANDANAQAEAAASEVEQRSQQLAQSDLAQAVAALLSPEMPSAARNAAQQTLAQRGEELAQNLDQIIAHAETELAEHAVDVQSRLLPEQTYLEVLPQYSPAFAALQQLATSRDPQTRQLAVGELARIASEEQLSAAVVDRLAFLLRNEQDTPLLRSALSAIQGTQCESARALARLAITHNDPEVARLACEFFGTCGDAEAARLLSDCLDHPTSAVAIAAANALGRCESMPDPTSLESLLVSPDRRLRIAAAASLARKEFQSGSDALQRLVHDADPQIRLEAAEMMGQLKRIEFVPILIDLLEDEPGVRRIALQSLQQIAQAYKIAPNHDAIDPLDPNAGWRDWYTQRSGEFALLPPVAKEWNPVDTSQPRAVRLPAVPDVRIPITNPPQGEPLFPDSQAPGSLR
mgnify:CR=1 FL=1